MPSEPAAAARSRRMVKLSRRAPALDPVGGMTGRRPAACGQMLKPRISGRSGHDDQGRRAVRGISGQCPYQGGSYILACHTTVHIYGDARGA